MNFLPSAEARALADAVRELLAARAPLERLGEGFRAPVWGAVAGLGVFGLRGEAPLEVAVEAFVELGRAAVPGPLVGSYLAGSDEPVAVLEAGSGSPEPAEPLLVAHLAAAGGEVLVVGGAELVRARGVAGEPVTAPVDPLTPLTLLAGVPDGEVVGDAAAAARARAQGALLTAALQVGLASRLTELAVGYAGEREQFGQRIGTFQAVKHLCADMFVRAELARVAVQAAAVTLDEDAGAAAGARGGRAVAGAKLLADEAALANGRSCVQVHGGMGFTWEVPVHYLLKRAWVHATEFGDADEHAEALATLL